MLEVYQAFGNYETMMDLTERMIVEAIDAIGGQYERPWGEGNIDFTPPFARKTYDELFAEHAGVDPRDREGRRRVGRPDGLRYVGQASGCREELCLRREG